ncbi:MAG: AraC family transcriptional regulator [Angelakisella sp.]
MFQKLVTLLVKNNLEASTPSPNNYTITYYKKGNGIVSIGSRNYKFSPGTYAVVPPNQIAEQVVTGDTEMVSVHFLADGDPTALQSGLYYDDNQLIAKHFEKLEREYSDQQIYQDVFLNIICTELYFTVIRCLHCGDGQNRMQEIVRYIQDYYAEEIRVEALAKMSGYSSRHFRLLFIKETGLAPTEYIIKCRLDAAKRQLATSNISIIRITQACGFSSSSQFSMLFKRDTNMTPKQYRRNAQSNL